MKVKRTQRNHVTFLVEKRWFNNDEVGPLRTVFEWLGEVQQGPATAEVISSFGREASVLSNRLFFF